MNQFLISLMFVSMLATACASDSGSGNGDAPAPKPTPSEKSQIEANCEKMWAKHQKATPKGLVAKYLNVSKTGDQPPVETEIVVVVLESTPIKLVTSTDSGGFEKEQTTMRLDFIEDCVAANGTAAPKNSTVVDLKFEDIEVPGGKFKTQYVKSTTPQGNALKIEESWYTDDLLLVKIKIENSFVLDGVKVPYVSTMELQSLTRPN